MFITYLFNYLLFTYLLFTLYIFIIYSLFVYYYLHISFLFTYLLGTYLFIVYLFIYLLLIYSLSWNQDRLVTAMTNVRAGRYGFRIRARKRNCLLLRNIQADYGAYPSPCSKVTVGYFPGYKAGGSSGWQLISVWCID